MQSIATLSASNVCTSVSLVASDLRIWNKKRFSLSVNKNSSRAVLRFLLIIFSLSPALLANAQSGCPSTSIEGTVLNPSNSPICSGRTSTINISVTPTNGTYSGHFTNGRTFTGLVPNAGIIRATYTFINNTTSNVSENFELDRLYFKPTGNTDSCMATKLEGNAEVVVQPVADIAAMLNNTSSILCNNTTVSITVSNPNMVGGTYRRTTTYGNAGHTALATVSNQPYGNFSDNLSNSTSAPITVTYTFIPVSVNSGCEGASMQVAVTINPNPAVTCPASKTVGNDPDVCTAVVNGIDPTFTPATCNGAAPTISYSATGATIFNGSGTAGAAASSASGKTFNKGVTMVTYSIVDAKGNIGNSCQFTVTVNDTQGPVFTSTPTNVTQNNDNNACGAIINYPAATATDNCNGLVTITYSQASGTFFPVGTTTVTVTATDDATPANTTTYTFTVTVNDTQLPVITSCPSVASTAANAGTCGAIVNYPAATATDNCAYTITYSQASGTYFPVGTTQVTVTVTDASNNTTTCNFNVVVTRSGGIYVNDTYTAGSDVYTSAAGNNMTGTGTKCAPYSTIQQAINMAMAGDSIYVDGGTYTEDVAVSKSLIIVGSNAGKNPSCNGSGHTNAATTIFPATNNPDWTTASYTKIVDITANNVTIDGFTLDGDKAPLNSYNAAVAIASNSTQSGLDIKNNIIKNIGSVGIDLSNNNGAMSSSNQVRNNMVANVAPIGSYGIGVYTGNNNYTDITNNCMTNVRKGIQGGENNYVANIGNVNSVWSGNTIQSYRIGIWNNLAYGAATPVTITNNTITTVPGSTVNRGIEISSLQNTASVTVSGNTIGDNTTPTLNGIYLWNNPTSNTVTIGTNTVTNCVYGVFATNRDGSFGNAASSSYILNGLPISGGSVGVYVQDSTGNTNNATVAVQLQNNTTLISTVDGLVVSGASSSASFSGAAPATFTGQSNKYIILKSNGADVPAANIDATAVTFDGQTGATASNAQNFAIEDKIDHKIDLLPLGFVTVKTANAFVTDIAPLAPTATNNDYTRVRNGILAASNGFAINHTGTFNWAETNAAAAWALGNDGVASTADDYSIAVPTNLNSVTFTAPDGLGTATIQGPGDLPGANLEGTLKFNGGDNQGWTISNMRFYDFDLSIGMFNGAGGSDAFNNTTITNNAFRIPKDLNAVAAPADASQNIGIHYSFGTNQTISGNTFEVDGTGVGSGSSNSTSIVMQSNTSGSTTYDGLKIINNTITVTGLPDATTPAVIRGIWENSQSSGAAIEISGNRFTNSAAGNTAGLNRQTAFWVTSRSKAGKKVEYKNNEVTGYRDGIAWLGGLYTSNTPPDYSTGETPVELMNNKFDGVRYSVYIRKSAGSTNPGSQAIVQYNSFTNTPANGYAIYDSATTSGTTTATCNWYGTTSANTIATLVKGPVTYSPYLLDGTDADMAATGFQTTAACNGTPVIIASATPSPETCGGNNGSITVTFSGGTGQYNLTYIRTSPTMPAVNGSAANITNPYTISNLPAGTYSITITDANNSTATATAIITYNPVTNTTQNATYTSIQAAINAANTNDTIQVCAGTYKEDIVVSKSVDLRGPNYNISPNGGTRVAEAIVVPATSHVDYNEVFHVAASGVKINGFTIDGDNPDLPANGYGFSGADQHAAEGVTVYEDNISNLSVSKNIFRNLSYFAVTLYGGSTSAPATAGHSITDNKMQNLGTYDNASGIANWGGGVLLYNNQYAAVTGNTMTNVRIGVQTGNFAQANPGTTASQVISGNTITARRRGIFHNLFYASASGYTLSNNSITAISNANETYWNGMLLASLSVPSTSTGNTVDGTAAIGYPNPTSGIDVWNVKNTTPAAISGGSVTGVANGVFVNNYDSYPSTGSNAGDGGNATLTGIAITNVTTGIRVKDNTASTHAPVTLAINSGVTVSTATDGLVIENSQALVSSLSNLAFSSISNKYISLIANANNLDATAVTFNGQTGGGSTLVQNYTIEDKINHKIDLTTLGFVLVKANNDFVTPNSYISPNTTANVQRGINAASSGFTVNVQGGGSYVGNTIVDKSLSILGPNDATAGCATRAAEAVLVPASSQPYYDGTSEVRLMQIEASNVTVKGLTFDGDNTSVSGGVSSGGADINAADGIDVYEDVAGITIQNNIFKNFNEGGINAYPSGTASQQNNAITSNKFDNIAGVAGMGFPNSGFGIGVLIYNNFYTTVDNNCMTNVRIGVQTGNYNLAGSPASISNNQIESKALGIWHNLTYQSASPFTISGNTLTTATGAAFNTGLFLSSIQSGVSATVTNNNITGAKWGIELWNNPTTNPVTISGGSLTDCETGIFANNFDSYASNGASSNYTVSGVAISSNVANNIGIHVKDNNGNTATTAVAIQNATIGSTAAASTGLLITGAGSSATFSGAGTQAAFAGQTKYIDLTANGADGAPAAGINATAVTFDGQTGAAASLADNYAIEDKIDHKIDSIQLGFVLVKAANTFVTPNSFIAPGAPDPKISRGVIAASAGFTENVQAGLYADTVTVNKQMTILGPNDAINPNTGTRVAEAVVVPAVNNVASGRVFNITANGVTIKGFTVDGDNTAITGGTAMNGADVNAAAGIATGVYPGVDGNSNTLIENNIVRNFDNTTAFTGGIYGNGSQSTAITGNIIRNNQVDNTKYWAILTESNWYANIQGNTITRGNRGIQVDGYFVAAPGVTTISGNNIRYYKRGIVSNNNFGNASQFAISSNVMTPETNGMNEDGGAGATGTNRGITVWSMASGTSGTTVSGNKITGAAVGEEFWNNAPGKASATADTILNTITTGILIPTNSTYGSAGYGSFVTISQDSINVASGADGLLVTDNDGVSGTAAQVNLTNTFVVGGTNSVRFSGPEISNTTVVNYNSLLGASNKAIDASAYTGSDSIAATCNWYGTTAVSSVATRISGSVKYVPYLSSGTDQSTTTAGFQPSVPCAACTGTVIATVTQTTSTCAGNNDGTLTVSNTNGGTGPYTYTISGPANNTGASSGVFTGLGQGTYTITVYQATGCSNTLAPVEVRDQIAPTFTSTPGRIANQPVNAANCQSTVTVPTPTYSDNCTLPAQPLSYVLTGATSGISGTGAVGTRNFNVGNTYITYTVTDQSSNTNVVAYVDTVEVVNTLIDSISGTATVVQNNTTTSNITFYGNGGTKPYTFTYSVNGGMPQTISTTGNNSVVTVPQSNAVAGQYIYTLISGTDAYGCAAKLPADTKDTITVTANDPRPDLVSAVSRPFNSTSVNGQVDDGYITISNATPNPTTGTITFRISKISNFTLTFPTGTSTPNAGYPVNNNNWTITDNSFFYEVTSKPNIPISGGGSSRIGFTLTTTGSTNSQGILTITILNGTGGSTSTNGDNNSTNNQSVKLFNIN